MAGLAGVRLCITGSFGNRDIGDEAMLTEDLAFIMDELGLPRENITLIGHVPEYIAEMHGHPIELCLPSVWFEQNHSSQLALSGRLRRAARRVRAVLRPRPPDRLGARAKARARSCDCLLVTGGGTVNTRDAKGASLRRMHALVTYFAGLGKPIFMSGQTIGPLGRCAEHDALASEIVESVGVLTARDSLYSRRYLEVIGARPTEFMETLDDAAALPYRDEPLPEEVARFIEGGEAAAVNVTDYTADTQEKREFGWRICEHLMDEYNLRVVLLSHATSDVYHLNIIRDMAPNNRKAELIVPNVRSWRASRLKKVISSCRLAVGGRYHFVVFAGTSNTPFVGMCGNHYSYIKQDGFARPFGLQDFVLTETETWDMQIVKARIREALSAKLDVERKLERPPASMRRFGEWTGRLPVAG